MEEPLVTDIGPTCLSRALNMIGFDKGLRSVNNPSGSAVCDQPACFFFNIRAIEQKGVTPNQKGLK
jgi:hypothetical protein